MHIIINHKTEFKQKLMKDQKVRPKIKSREPAGLTKTNEKARAKVNIIIL